MRLPAWIAFLLEQFATSILVLNILIALVSETIAKVHDERLAYDTLPKVALLEELNFIYMVLGVQ